MSASLAPAALADLHTLIPVTSEGQVLVPLNTGAV